MPTRRVPEPGSNFSPYPYRENVRVSIVFVPVSFAVGESVHYRHDSGGGRAHAHLWDRPVARKPRAARGRSHTSNEVSRFCIATEKGWVHERSISPTLLRSIKYQLYLQPSIPHNP